MKHCGHFTSYHKAIERSSLPLKLILPFDKTNKKIQNKQIINLSNQTPKCKCKKSINKFFNHPLVSSAFNSLVAQLVGFEGN